MLSQTCLPALVDTHLMLLTPAIKCARISPQPRSHIHTFTLSPSWRQMNGIATNIHLRQAQSLSWAVLQADYRRETQRDKQAPALPRAHRSTIQTPSLRSAARLPASSKLTVGSRTAAYSVCLTPSFRDPAHSQICLSATIMCIYYSEEISTYS